MCGIAGIIRVTPPGAQREPVPEAWLEQVQRNIAWRGPDGHGLWRDVATRSDGSTVEAVLIHARLSIIDLACGAQPMISEAGPGGSGTVAVVFNGCIYNHRALRPELQAQGHRFQTDHSDTEVLIHGWRQWGERLADHLDGMYAVAIWDRDKAQCTLLRDRPGEKPLYYTSVDDGRTLVFASTLPTVLGVRRAATGEGTPRLSRDALVDWFRFGWGEHLPYADVREAPPRTTLVFPAPPGTTPEAHGVATVHRIELPQHRDTTPHLTTDVVERLLERSIADRTDADVPLGCFLSGGVDSSLVSLYAKRAMGRLTTLCVRFPVGSYDESPYAAEAARVIGSEHITIDVNPSASEDMVKLLGILGLPYGDSSLLPTHWVSNAAKQHVKVVLAGDGGDELFLGYRRHKASMMLKRIEPFLHLLPRRIPGMDLTKGSRSARALRFFTSIRALGYQSMLSWTVPDILAVLPGEAERFYTRRMEFPDPSLRDFQEYLLYDLNRKSDTAAMAAPIELRAPIMSNDMINAALSEPISSIMSGGQLKGILRDLMRKHFPASLVDRPKQGFGVPVGDFFRDDFGGMGSLLREMLSGPAPFGPVHDVMEIDVKYVHTMIDDHMERRREHASRLYILLATSIWSRQLAA